MALELRNPHSVLAALERRPVDVLEIRLQTGQPSGAWQEVVELAARSGIPVLRGVGQREGGRRRSKQQATKERRTGAGEATVKPAREIPLERLFSECAARSEGRGIWLALDCVQDPHNVGAIFRAASFFGIEGILLTKDRSAPLNTTVYDVASGGMEYVPFSVQTNLSRALETAREAGLWILGSSEHAESDVFEVQRDRPWMLVLGNEEKGMRRLTQDKCDAICRLQPRGKVTSLNVSVAAGSMMAILTAPR